MFGVCRYRRMLFYDEFYNEERMILYILLPRELSREPRDGRMIFAIKSE